MRSPQIHEPGEGLRTIDIGGGIMVAKADGTTTDDAFVVVETTLQPGGFEPPLHLQSEMAEFLYVLGASLTPRRSARCSRGSTEIYADFAPDPTQGALRAERAFGTAAGRAGEEAGHVDRLF